MSCIGGLSLENNLVGNMRKPLPQVKELIFVFYNDQIINLNFSKTFLFCKVGERVG